MQTSFNIPGAEGTITDSEAENIKIVALNLFPVYLSHPPWSLRGACDLRSQFQLKATNQCIN